MNAMREKYEAIRREYPFRIDMHVHTYYASPEEQVRYYKSKGIDALCVTNHLTGLKWRERETPFPDKERHCEWYINNYRRAKAEGDKLGVRVYLAAEITFQNHGGEDFLIYGIDESGIYRVFDILDSYGEDDMDYVKDLYTLMKDEHSLIIRAHPFRLKDLPVGDLRYLDGIELINPRSNSDMAMKLALDNDITILTAGSDCHGQEENHFHPCIRVKELPEDGFGLTDIIKSGDYVIDADGFIVV